MRIFGDVAAEQAAVGRWIADRLGAGCAPHEIGILVRVDGQVRRARAAAKAAGAPAVELGDKVEATPG